MNLEEYCLMINDDYFAKVSAESYYLPPENPEGEPKECENLVLWVSDFPFQGWKTATGDDSAFPGD